METELCLMPDTRTSSCFLTLGETEATVMGSTGQQKALWELAVSLACCQVDFLPEIFPS